MGNRNNTSNTHRNSCTIRLRVCLDVDLPTIDVIYLVGLCLVDSIVQPFLSVACVLSAFIRMSLFCCCCSVCCALYCAVLLLYCCDAVLYAVHYAVMCFIVMPCAVCFVPVCSTGKAVADPCLGHVCVDQLVGAAL